ncbi:MULTISPECIES: hypothetical protein [unclassified Vibrio]|uniref:hypothetical protein n=1 Tax=unclassified Vibrio TaxID=2614977 RepID=UPI0010BCF309|nr:MULTISPECIES: hypothetical protein [unclassified Vibrio]TKE71623.1 hypothetical protein FCV45_07080 [Vibrio sp. F12]
MKRYQYLCLLVLLSAPVLSADVSYSGTYSQLKVKLCSDTPPSRSLLPSGSLVCDENPPQSNTLCVGSWDYSSTDVFNCGSQVEQDGDLNNNGIPDNDEDWDGDGLANGVDPNPTLNDNAELDEDNNGIPDKLDPFFERYKASRAEVVTCDGADPDCKSSDVALYGLMNTNRDLTNIINLMVSGDVDQKFSRTLRNLRETMTNQELQTREKLEGIKQAINNIDTGGVDNSALIKREFLDVDAQFSEADTKLEMINDNVLDVKGYISNIGGQLYEVKRSAQNAADSSNQTLDAINNLDVSGSGLTSQQKTQLRNAAKANANQKLLKELKPLAEQNLAVTRAVERNLDWFNEDFTAYSEKTDGQFSQLSDQIAAISGGQSTVDLSGVESSIDALSDKIDGLDTSDMSGVESKLTDLIDGVTNDNNFVEPTYGFNGEGFIVTQNQIADVQNEVLEIKQEMTDEFEKFKALFSIDTSSFNNGTYKEHTLNLNVNHAERSFKSGVLSALLENATIISAVVMFLFVLSGIRMLGKD